MYEIWLERSIYLEKNPGYGLENFWVAAYQGRMVAFAGLRDCSTIAEFCYTREPASWKAMGIICELLGRFGKVPKLVKQGEYFQFHYLADCAFDHQHPEAMKSHQHAGEPACIPFESISAPFPSP